VSDANRLPHLLSSGFLGSLELRNRILMCPMGHHLSNPDGSISANEAAYFEARAAGEAALVIIGNVGIASPSGTSDGRMTAVSDDERHLPGLLDLTARVHAHGGRIAAQINHQGKMSLLDAAEGRPMLVPYVPHPGPPDPLAAMVTAEEQAAMTAPFTRPGARFEFKIADSDDIGAVIEQYADAADRCVRAGFDGVEVHAGHGYLIDEFLSPHNDRDDGWGGDLPGRARFLLDVIRAVRARVGDAFPVWIRINATEPHKDDGERLDEQLQVIDLAVDAGIDAVHVTAYADDSTGPTDSYAPHVVGPLRDHAAAVKARVAVPVITMGRYEPDEADALIADGVADFVAMGRKLIADPDLPRKLREERTADVRPCIYQYRCIGNIYVGEPLRCVANARSGREHDTDLSPVAHPRRVLVVGGGPAGLGAARTLATRGHSVTLWERAPSLGGLLRSAARTEEVLARYEAWLVRQVEEQVTEVVLGRDATRADVEAAAPDAVVVATGATWARPEVPGAERAMVRPVSELDAWFRDGDALDTRPGVVVLGGGKVGLSVAALCRARGVAVTVVEESSVLGVELGLPGRFRLVHDLDIAGARLLAGARADRIDDASVRVVSGDGDVEHVPAGLVVATAGAVATAPLADDLRATGIEVHVVGDARAVRLLEGAERDAVDLAVALV
jgi:2,4-dienoyl-CoA reductase (NADPH2)